jgi:phage shock protein PspC (stress-responsive transcriptional regulator)/anti-sigma regulatory factor (Ser/Thr protein kinase)
MADATIGPDATNAQVAAAPPPQAPRSGQTSQTSAPQRDTPRGKPPRQGLPARGRARLGALAFPRSRSNRVIAGVAGGLSERLGVDPILTRIAFVLLTIAGGIGVVVYVVLALITDDASPDLRTPVREPTRRRTFGFALVIAGAMLLLREVGFWFGDRVVWPVTLAAIGSAVIWARGDDDRGRWLSNGGGNPIEALFGDRSSIPRVLVGGLMVATGMGYALATSDTLATAGSALLAIGVTTAGLVLILGPWILRLYRALTEERRERIRSAERAEMAAHLHDSVLHTLALIQRADAPMEVVTLARRQERELRSWLYEEPAPPQQERLKSAVEALASRVEELHAIAVDVVVVGDEPLDERSRAVVLACQEAAVNAARHSGVTTVSVYVEAEPDGITAYVRDEGKGFDPDSVPPDRRGIRDSIRGRIERQGGTVTITSEPGGGTEVAIQLPRERR